MTGFRSRAVKQFHAVNRKCNRRRVSILVSRQFTRHTKDNALQEQFLPMRTLSPLTQKQIAYIIYCYVRVVRRKISNQLKSTELKIMDSNQILNLCSFRAADAATPQ